MPDASRVQVHTTICDLKFGHHDAWSFDFLPAIRVLLQAHGLQSWIFQWPKLTPRCLQISK
jgi:hypothetical protein